MSEKDEYKVIISLLPEEGDIFPVGKGIECVKGKTLAKTSSWWKAIVLVKSNGKKEEKYQLRLYGWQKKVKPPKPKKKIRQEYLKDMMIFLTVQDVETAWLSARSTKIPMMKL